MRTIILTLITLFAFSTTASAQWGSRKVEGSGNLKTETRKVGDDFTAVKSCCSMIVNVTKGNTHSVEVIADDNVLNYITTEVYNERLMIRIQKGVDLRTSQRVQVNITMPTVTGLYASSSSDLICSGSFTGDELEMDVSSSGEIEVDFTGREVEIEGSSSGRIRLAGSAELLEVDLSSSGRVSAKEFTTKRLDAEASSSGRVTVMVTEAIDADVSSSGKVNYIGNPKKVITDASSGGKVSKID